MANEYLMAILKNNVGEGSLPSIKEGDGPPSNPPSFCPSSRNSSIGDADELEFNTLGLRSPNGQMRGKTVKEFEEQMANLKKENFNLKLRIYFLEEKLGVNFTFDKDNILKKNIQLQMEVTNLQKEVKENHDLLSQAVKAMEEEEERHKVCLHNKEGQIEQLQQEMEDLRRQLQDVRFLGSADSPKSPASSRQSEQDNPYQHEFVLNLDYQRRYMNDGDLVKGKPPQPPHFAYETESLKEQIDMLQRECENKNVTIEGLNRDLTQANERVLDLLAKRQEDQWTKEDLKAQLTSLIKKYHKAQMDFDQERDDLMSKKKSLERNNAILDMRVSELSNETQKQKELLKGQRAQLEVAVSDAKKSQNVAVSPSHSDKQSASNTDVGFISAPRAATPDGDAQESALLVQIKQEGATGRSKRSTRAQGPSTPDGKSLSNFEKLLSENASVNDAVLAEFKALKNDFTIQQQKIVRLKSNELKACEVIKHLVEFNQKSTHEIAQLKRSVEELEDKARREKKKAAEQQQLVDGTPRTEKSGMADTEDAVPQDGGADLEIVEQYQRLTVELEAKMEVLIQTLKEKDSQMQYVRTQYDEILTTLEEKENRIVDLEFELLSLNQNSGSEDRSTSEKADNSSEKHSSFYKQELEEKNQEIERLNIELKKCTCYLQEIVNKELWEKNREIEKMHKKQETTSEVAKLKRELSGKDSQLKLLKEKIHELGLDIKLPSNESDVSKDLSSPTRNIQHIKMLQEQLKVVKDEKQFLENRLGELRSSELLVDKLKYEISHLKIELENSERLRHETNEVCSVLGARLEELAVFLDSLLKQKSVLGFLGSAKNKRLREIINNSLDVSRSFGVSLMSNPDQSLAQLSNITALLNGSAFQELSLAPEERGAGEVEEEEEEMEATHLSIVPERISLTYESHLHRKNNGSHPDNEQVIAALRQQVFNLKNELRVRDNELNRLQHDAKESGVERLSDNGAEEGNEHATAPNSTPKSTSATLKAPNSEAHSESEAWSEPDRVVSRARIGLNRSVPPMANPNHYESTEDDDVYHSLTASKRRSALIELSQDVYRLQRELEEKSEELIANSVMHRRKLQDLDKEVQESRDKLDQAEMDKNSVLKKLEISEKIVEELTAFKTQCEATMIGKDKEMQEKINRLEVEKQKILGESQAYAQQVIDAKNQVIAAQDKVKALEQQMETMQTDLRKEYEESLIEKLKSAEEVFVKKVTAMEEKCDAEVRIAQENVRLIQDEYARDFIKKTEVEKKLLEAESLVTELNQLKVIVQSYDQTIASYKEKEQQINDKVQEYENKLAALNEQLVDATGRCCQVTEEKQLLEQEVAKVSEKERELRTHLKNIQNNLSEVSVKYTEQVTTLQKQKASLELKVSELESSNAELYNRLVKAQTSRFSLGLNATLPPHIGSNKLSYRRQFSDQNAYSSEDNGEDSRGFALNRTPQVNVSLQPSMAEAERVEANSSPDLGIESDHGRFSSLETNVNNIPRPLLQTIELTESMNNLFEGENKDVETNKPVTSEHCCRKLVDVMQENNELKRKLLRMKRALEETATQLNLANQRKKQVEKTICKQIDKTSQVLRKAKANLDSGSESDVFRK